MQEYDLSDDNDYGQPNIPPPFWIPPGTNMYAQGESTLEELVNLIKSGNATPQMVAQILGLDPNEYDPEEFTMPTEQQLNALRPGSYLEDFTAETMKYNKPMAQTALNIGSMQGGLRTSQDKVRGDLQSMLSPYRGAIDTAQTGMESSMHRAESDIWDLAGEWMSKAHTG